MVLHPLVDERVVGLLALLHLKVLHVAEPRLEVGRVEERQLSVVLNADVLRPHLAVFALEPQGELSAQLLVAGLRLWVKLVLRVVCTILAQRRRAEVGRHTELFDCAICVLDLLQLVGRLDGKVQILPGPDHVDSGAHLFTDGMRTVEDRLVAMLGLVSDVEAVKHKGGDGDLKLVNQHPVDAYK
eukprot:7239840-Prymnesium_polylepis.1